MAKKRKSAAPMEMPSYKPPSAQEQMHSAAEHMGRTVMETHPKFKRMRDAITQAVSKAAKKAVGGSARKGSFS